MNMLTYAAPTDVIHEVLQKVAPPVTQGEPTKGALGGAAANNFELAVEESWVRFQALVERCVREGYEAVHTEITEFTGKVEIIAKELGRRADEFKKCVLEKVRETIVATFDALLSCLRITVLLGGRSYVLDSINLEHKLVYSGSLEVSVTTLCKFIGGGELVVKGSYKMADSAQALGA